MNKKNRNDEENEEKEERGGGKCFLKNHEQEGRAETAIVSASASFSGGFIIFVFVASKRASRQTTKELSLSREREKLLRIFPLLSSSPRVDLSRLRISRVLYYRISALPRENVIKTRFFTNIHKFQI